MLHHWKGTYGSGTITTPEELSAQDASSWQCEVGLALNASDITAILRICMMETTQRKTECPCPGSISKISGSTVLAVSHLSVPIPPVMFPWVISGTNHHQVK